GAVGAAALAGAVRGGRGRGPGPRRAGAQALDPRPGLLRQPGRRAGDGADEAAGRGVGLDVVRRVIEGLGGDVRVESELGRGTELTFSVPAALTQERLVVVQTGDVLYGIPSHWVVSIERRSGEEEAKDGEAATFSWRGE